MRCFIILSILVLGIYSKSQSYSLTLTWGGGLPMCTQCGGAGNYACSSGIGNWNNGTLSFIDPAPPHSGNVLTSVSAVLLGSYSCGSSSPTEVQVLLQDVVVDDFLIQGSKQCKCGTCDGPTSPFSSGIFNGGWPNFNYGGKNFIQVVVESPNNPICLYSIALNLTYSTKSVISYVSFTLNYLSSQKDSCLTCGTNSSRCTSSPNWNSGMISFKDPIPSGNIVLSASAEVYLKVGFSDTHTFTTTLTGIALGSKTVTGNQNSIQCYDCFGGLSFGSTQIYQAGWPGYSYGGTNILIVNLDFDHPYCVSRVFLTLGFYPVGEVLPLSL